MVKMKWIITDDVSNISSEEFDSERNGIVAGYFELIINMHREGFCPQKIINEKEEGLEDILYWLRHLLEGCNMVKVGKKYEMILLTRNRYKIVMKLDNKMFIYFVEKSNNSIKWKEEVFIEEFESELRKNIKDFKNYIEQINPNLLKSRWIKNLVADVDYYL